MKKYEYLVAYNFSMEGYLTTCSGTIQVFRKKKIKSFNDIIELNNLITESIPGSSNVSVYNLILLGRNKHKN